MRRRWLFGPPDLPPLALRVWGISAELARLSAGEKESVEETLKDRVSKDHWLIAARYWPAIAFLATLPLLRNLRGPAPLVTYFALNGLLALGGQFAILFIGRKQAQREFRAIMTRRGEPMCLECGYNLRGSIESPRCPECGTVSGNKS